MQKLACIRIFPKHGAAHVSPERLEDWAERFSLFGRASWCDAATLTIFVESHGRLGLYGGAKGWAETLRGFAEGMGLETSVVVGFTAERLKALSRQGEGILTLVSKEEERRRVLMLPPPETLDLSELGPLWARIA